MRFSEAIRRFEDWRGIKLEKGSIRGYEYDLRQFCLFVRDTHIENIKLEDVVEYFNLMTSIGWKRNSFTTKSIALRGVFRFFEMQGYDVLDYNLILIPKREYNQARVANHEQYQKLLGIIPQNTKDAKYVRNRAMIKMLWDTGARVGEILSLKVKDLDLDEMNAVIKTEKNQGSRPFRQIFWTEDTNNSLADWIRLRESKAKRGRFIDPDILFIGFGRWTVGKKLSNNAVSSFFRRYSYRAGIEQTNPHSFRHRFGHDLAEKGASNSIISGLMGHASLASSYIYTMMNSNELKNAYKKFKGCGQLT